MLLRWPYVGCRIKGELTDGLGDSTCSYNKPTTCVLYCAKLAVHLETGLRAMHVVWLVWRSGQCKLVPLLCTCNAWKSGISASCCDACDGEGRECVQGMYNWMHDVTKNFWKTKSVQKFWKVRKVGKLHNHKRRQNVNTALGKTQKQLMYLQKPANKLSKANLSTPFCLDYSET